MHRTALLISVGILQTEIVLFLHRSGLMLTDLSGFSTIPKVGMCATERSNC